MGGQGTFTHRNREKGPDKSHKLMEVVLTQKVMGNSALHRTHSKVVTFIIPVIKELKNQASSCFSSSAGSIFQVGPPHHRK